MGVDYVTLSPVEPTASHPDAEPLGWPRFAELVELARVPVYALGGMSSAHIAQARSVGAQGIAGMRFGWEAGSATSVTRRQNRERNRESCGLHWAIGPNG